jgi:hypothetical protein
MEHVEIERRPNTEKEAACRPPHGECRWASFANTAGVEIPLHTLSLIHLD